MPTGYTAEIENDIQFEDYVLGCARAFGACVHQRDENSNIKPALRQEDTYYAERLEKAKAKVQELEALKPQDRIEYGEKVRLEELSFQQKYFNDKILLKNKYEAMLQKAVDWTPPTPGHAELKNFMIQQIQDSIRHDCDTDYTLEQITKLSQERPVTLFEKELTSAKRDVIYNTEQLEKNTKAIQESNQWIVELYKSLGVKYE